MNRLPLTLVSLLSACAPAGTAPAPLASGPVAVPTPEALARAALPSASRARLRDAPVPVLVPPDRALLHRAVLTVGPRWYALSTDTDGLHVSVHATDEHHPAREGEEAPTARDHVRGAPAWSTLNDGIRSVSWLERGVAYTLELECSDVEHDARCLKSDDALALAERLVLVGGAR